VRVIGVMGYWGDGGKLLIKDFSIKLAWHVKPSIGEQPFIPPHKIPHKNPTRYPTRTPQVTPYVTDQVTDQVVHVSDNERRKYLHNILERELQSDGLFFKKLKFWFQTSLFA